MRGFKSSQIIDKFQVTNGMDDATEMTLLASGLRELLQDGLAKKIWSSPTHSLYVYPKLVPYEPYETLVTLLPNSPSDTTISCVSALSPSDLADILQATTATLFTLADMCQNDGYDIKKKFFFQHVGPKDLLPKKPYNTSYAPLHFHLQVQSDAISDYPGFEPIEVDISQPMYRNTFKDPLFDFVRSATPFTPYNNTSFRISTHDFNKPITPALAASFIHFHRQWEQHYAIIEKLLGITKHGHSPRPKPHDDERIRILAKRDDAPYPLDALLQLAHVIRKEPRDEWDTMYRGINGSVGFAIDPGTKQADLLFSPKLLANHYRHFDLVNTEHIIVKDRQNPVMMAPEYRNTLLNIQRRLIAKLHPLQQP